MMTQEDRMKKALDAVVGNFNTIRTGRANPAILDRIMVRDCMLVDVATCAWCVQHDVHAHG